MDRFSAAFVVLLLACIVAIYALRVRPRSRREWLMVSLTIALMAWLLLGQGVPVQ